VSDILIGAVVMPSGSPQLMAYVESYLQTGPQQYRLSLAFVDPTKTTTNWSGPASLQLYLPIKAEWQYGINTDGDPTVRKHFS